MPEIKPVKVFSRENPCTKVHIHNAFVGPDGKYRRRPVVEAQSEIGANSPKYLLREGYAIYVTEKNVDYYELTLPGQKWLADGLTSHLARHPTDRKNVLMKRTP